MSIQDDLDVVIDFMWAVSVVAMRPSRAHIAGIEFHHDVLLKWASNVEEVRGYALDEYSKTYKYKDGYSIYVSEPVPLKKAALEALGGYKQLIEQADAEREKKNNERL